MTGAFTESVVEDAALRDTLLPKLISGELRVKGSTEIVGAVA
jgi:hypothetical protein